MKSVLASLARLALLVLLCALSLQLYFLARVTTLIWVDPQSTTFQRSELWRLIQAPQALRWRQQWVALDAIGEPLKRAVIAAEDAGFAEHSGVEWDALEKAWERNQAAEERAEARADKAAAQGRAGQAAAAKSAPGLTLVGGSTITQQLAKNLFLGAERSLPRKTQEFVITLMLEALLSKQRILEIYLNHVEWGEGVFGAQAAAQHYFQVDAAHLRPLQAAQLAVMLPAPRRFEKRPRSAYLMARARTVAARMGSVDLP